MPTFTTAGDSVNWLDLIKKHHKILTTSLIGVGLFVGLVDLGWLLLIGNRSLSIECPDHSVAQVATDSGKILVDIRGEVKKPGVYVMDPTERLGAAVERAGGLTKMAHASYVLHALNYAQPLTDAQKIYIPHQEETQYCQKINQFSSELAILDNADNSLVSINTASPSELETLTGIGAKRAEDIVAGRPYQTINQLIEQKIITNDIFEQIKSQISL